MRTYGDDPARVLDALVDPVLVIDERFVVVGGNAAAERFFAVGPGELVGRASLDWVHEPDRIEAADRLGSAMAGAVIRPASIRLVAGSGDLEWIEVTGAPFPADDGSLRMALVIRRVSWRLARELESARSVARAHLLAGIAVELQSISPGRFTEVTAEVLHRLGPALGVGVLALHEVAHDKTSFVLRARWADQGDPIAARAIAPASVPAAEVAAWSTALIDTADVVEAGLGGPALENAFDRLEPAFGTGLSVPLSSGEELLGALTASWPEGHRLTNDEREVMESSGRILGTAMAQVRAHQALVEREELFRDLFHNSSAVMYLVDPDTLRLVDANQAAADFYGYSRESMAGMDLHELTVHGPEELRSDLERLQRAGRTTVIDERQVLADGAERNVEIHSTRIRIGRRHLDLAIVQDMTEERLARAELERLASTDELTGCLNRRRFLQAVEEELARADRYDRPAVLAMLDLDHFKRLNDARGHVAGDAALVAFAERCRQEIRTEDCFARLGGEEFAVFMPETTLDDALVAAERIRVAVEDAGVSVSIGVASHASGVSLGELYLAADRKLYEAKAAGRNRVVA